MTAMINVATIAPCNSAAGRAVCPDGHTDFWEQEGKLFQYPPAFCIRNTFVDGKVTRTPSLDEYFTERQVRSCPASQIEVFDLPSCSADEGARGAHSSTTSAGSSGGTSVGEPELDEARADIEYFDETPDATPHAAVPTLLSLGSLLSLNSQGSGARSAASSLDHVVAQNVGSASHGKHCKPCAFFHTKGCESGADCVFCHECPPLEKKRRKKERAQARSMGQRCRMKPSGYDNTAAQTQTRCRTAGMKVQAIAHALLQTVPISFGMNPGVAERELPEAEERQTSVAKMDGQPERLTRSVNVEHGSRPRWSEECDEE